MKKATFFMFLSMTFYVCSLGAETEEPLSSHSEMHRAVSKKEKLQKETVSLEDRAHFFLKGLGYTVATGISSIGFVKLVKQAFIGMCQNRGVEELHSFLYPDPDTRQGPDYERRFNEARVVDIIRPWVIGLCLCFAGANVYVTYRYKTVQNSFTNLKKALF